MKCKKCGAELPIDVKFCDICGCPVERETYKQRKKKDAEKRKKVKHRAFVIVPIVLICLSLVGYKLWDMFWLKNIHLDRGYSMITRVSVDEYKKVELGMTYKEVCKIVGGRGKLESIVGTSKAGMRRYMWGGEYADKKNNFYSEMSVRIDNNSKKIDSIDEYNLLDAEEILANHNNDTEIQYKKYAKIDVGMTLKEVEDLLGNKGVLHHSGSTKTDNKQTTRKEYRWVGPDNQEIIVDFENDIVERANEYGFKQ